MLAIVQGLTLLSAALTGAPLSGLSRRAVFGVGAGALFSVATPLASLAVDKQDLSRLPAGLKEM